MRVLIPATLALFGSGFAARIAARKSKRNYAVVQDHQMESPVSPIDERGFPGARLDLRRKDSIIEARPVDHSYDVVLARYPNFDLGETIFQNIDDWIKKQYLSATLNIQSFWNDKAVFRVQGNFVANVPAPPDVNRDMLNWMNTECDFAMEHADGSFFDHLKWGYEYSVRNYPERSPKVLLLHSIMGVGTNFFPIRLDQVKKLRTFIDDFEYRQIEVFPSMLRLFYADKILPELEAYMPYLDNLEGVEMHRVIDNEKVYLSAEDFWAAANFQLVHLVDFVPISNWNETATSSDPFLVLFTKVYNLLKGAGKMEAKVGFVPPVVGGDAGPNPELTFGSLIQKIAPGWAKWQLFTSSVEGMSKDIGHSLSYTLKWKDRSKCPKKTSEKCWIFCDGPGAKCQNGECLCPSGTCPSNNHCI